MTDPCTTTSNTPTPSSKPTRRRTGCQRCRIRRRKCDEGKPRCRNCIDKNFDCKYSVHVTFLRKNTFTLAPTENRMLSSPEGYETIKFVQEDPQVYNANDPTREDSPSRIETVSAASVEVSSNDATPFADNGRLTPTLTAEQDGLGLNERNRINQAAPSYFLGSRNGLDSHGVRPSIASDTQPGESPLSDRDNFAVRSLLALVANDARDASMIAHRSPSQSNLTRNFQASPPRTRIRRGTVDGPDSAMPSSPSAGRVTSSNPLPIATKLPPSSPTEGRVLELLRHYRYHVASWLDMCDMTHCFGNAAVRMAMGSEKLLSALLMLSEACLISQELSKSEVSNDWGSSTGSKVDHYDADNNRADLTAMALQTALDKVRSLLSDISHAWIHPSDGHFDIVASLVEHAFDMDLNSAIYWLFLRLELSVALANGNFTRLPVPTSQTPNLFMLAQTENTYDRFFHYAHALLLLCWRAVFLCTEEGVIIAQPGASHRSIDSWRQLVKELDQWYRMRPPEFHPMVDLDAHDPTLSSDGGFSLVLFTNGAAVFSNQLYHTAMLMLLQDKPRTVQLTDFQSSVLSPLWHARRICSIALNNDRRDWWDPCLLASSLMTARYMTHESQQQEILQGFERIRNLTGWDISRSLDVLREEWSSLEDP